MFLERIEVFSLEIASLGYDETTSVLQVEFHNMCIYNFFDVPKEYYEKCICADSVEKYFQINIKNHFTSDRIL